MVYVMGGSCLMMWVLPALLRSIAPRIAAKGKVALFLFLTYPENVYSLLIGFALTPAALTTATSSSSPCDTSSSGSSLDLGWR